MVLQMVTHMKQGVFMQKDILNAIYYVVKHFNTNIRKHRYLQEKGFFVRNTIALGKLMTVRTSVLEKVILNEIEAHSETSKIARTLNVNNDVI